MMDDKPGEAQEATTTMQLTDALKQWRVAKSADDELRWYVAGQMMADAIDRFLQETTVVEGDRK